MLKGLLPTINFNFNGALNLFASPAPGKAKWRVISTVCSLLISSEGSALPVEKGFRFSFSSLQKIVVLYWGINLFHCRSRHTQRKKKKESSTLDACTKCYWHTTADPQAGSSLSCQHTHGPCPLGCLSVAASAVTLPGT